MAIYPCNVGQHRYAGPQQSVYVTWVKGSQAVTGKARLCPGHFAEVAATANVDLTPIDEALQSSLVCETCDDPTTEHVYLTLYRPSSEGEAYAGDFCGVHAAYVLGMLGWPNFTRRDG